MIRTPCIASFAGCHDEQPLLTAFTDELDGRQNGGQGRSLAGMYLIFVSERAQLGQSEEDATAEGPKDFALLTARAARKK